MLKRLLAWRGSNQGAVSLYISKYLTFCAISSASVLSFDCLSFGVKLWCNHHNQKRSAVSPLYQALWGPHPMVFRANYWLYSQEYSCQAWGTRDRIWVCHVQDHTCLQYLPPMYFGCKCSGTEVATAHICLVTLLIPPTLSPFCVNMLSLWSK